MLRQSLQRRTWGSEEGWAGGGWEAGLSHETGLSSAVGGACVEGADHRALCQSL